MGKTKKVTDIEKAKARAVKAEPKSQKWPNPAAEKSL